MQEPTCQLHSSLCGVHNCCFDGLVCVLRLHAVKFECCHPVKELNLIAGKELDLRRFHEAIEECGGFDAAVTNKKFGRIAVKLGIDLAVATNAAYLLK